MKPTREKRTTTQPGLGKVGPGRRSTLGGQSEADPSFENPPISAPPPSGGTPSARMTRPIEQPFVGDHPESRPSSQPSQPSHARTPSEKPVASERIPRREGGADPRSEGEPSPSGRIERVEQVDMQPKRTSDARRAIEVTTDKKRLNRSSSRPPAAKPQSRPPKDVAQRPSVGGFSAVEVATGRRAISGTAGAPVAIEDRAATGPARSKRVSIREHKVGARVNELDAVGATGRVVPRLLKTKAELAAAPIDHRAGFLLAHIDGVTTVQGLVDVTGMPEEEVDQILDRLRRLGIVAVR
jgi:hypothetical protein